MNDFQTCLEDSHQISEMPFWKGFYKSAFPTMVGMHSHPQNGEHQYKGIDRTIILANGRTIWIDEKVRGRNAITGRVYGDIALEEWSSEEQKKEGWITKALLADYIAYVILPLGRGYLLPVVQLQKAWSINAENWKKQHHPIKSKNEGYTTISWGIPVNVLFAEMGNCHRIFFPALEFKKAPMVEPEPESVI